MANQDRRIPLYLGNSLEDRILRDRITVGAKSLSLSNSKFLREAAVYALDNVIEFDRSIRRSTKQ